MLSNIENKMIDLADSIKKSTITDDLLYKLFKPLHEELMQTLQKTSNYRSEVKQRMQGYKIH